MKKQRIAIFAVAGGIVGLGVHLLWHSLLRIELFTAGPHVTTGTIYTIAGIIIGIIFYFLISKK